MEDLKYFENRNKIKINIISDDSLIIPDYIVTFENKTKKVIEKIESIKKLKNLKDIELEKKDLNSNLISKKEKFNKNKFKKKKFYKKNILKKLNQTLCWRRRFSKIRF